MRNKVTWKDIYKDFKNTYSKLGKEALEYRPHDFLTIKICFKDGRIGLYNFMTKELKFTKETWIHKD